MANSYFQFKQFIVHQDRCAMKVTTDGCLFGAFAAEWLFNWFKTSFNSSKYILDIGAGTGLLSLMMAQKNPEIFIDAIEIDTISAAQALENFNSSLWKGQLKIHQSSIQEFVGTNINKYDLIISNPPFYEQQLQSENRPKNIAHHSAELTLEELFFCVNKLIKSDGYFIVLLPFYRMVKVIEIINNYDLYLKEKILIKQTPKHNYFRSILIFSRIKNVKILEEEIIIKDEQNEYTNRFHGLLKDYYLHI